MSLSNLYFRGCFERPSQEQIDAIEAIPGGNVESTVVDRSCVREDLNTCGISIQELLFDKEQVFKIDSRSFPRGDVDISSDTIKIPNHKLTRGEIAYYSSESTPIGGLNESDKYFVKPITKDYIQLYTSSNFSENSKVNISSESVDRHRITSININSESLVVENISSLESGDTVYYHCENVKTFNITGVDTVNNTFTISNFSLLNDGDRVYFRFQKSQESDTPISPLSADDRFFVKKKSENKISIYQYDALDELSIVNISGALLGINSFQRIDNIGGLSDNNSYFIKIRQDNSVSLHTQRSLSESSLVRLNGTFSGIHSLNRVYKNFLRIPPIEIYSTQKGLYKTWGDIEFPWKISSLTPDLFFQVTNDKWSISTYRRITAYAEGTRVFLIENDGYEIGLYQANQDIVSISGPFDYSKWNKICGIKTTIQVGLPTIEELRERYAPYVLEYFYDEWEEIDSTWSEGTYELALQTCQNQGGTLGDFEKCMKDSSSDAWKDARVRREFFYKRGDIVLVEGECEDVLCVWIAIQDMPATEMVYNEYLKFKPGPYWQKIYCVNSNRNKCLEYQRQKEPSLGYDVVQIGSLGHYVEVPVPYRLKPTTLNLNDRAQPRSAPTVLTQEQIDALTQPTEE